MFPMPFMPVFLEGLRVDIVDKVGCPVAGAAGRAQAEAEEALQNKDLSGEYRARALRLVVWMAFQNETFDGRAGPCLAGGLDCGVGWALAGRLRRWFGGALVDRSSLGRRCGCAWRGRLGHAARGARWRWRRSAGSGQGGVGADGGWLGNGIMDEGRSVR